MRIAGYLTFVVMLAAALIGTGVAMSARQQRLVHGSVAAPGIIVSSEAGASVFGGYQPRVKVRYQVRGVEYFTRRVTPLPSIGSEVWADQVVRQFPQGASVTVYVERNNAASACLVRTVRFFPYLLILAGVAVPAFSVRPLRRGGVFERRPDPVAPGRYDWYKLSASAPLSATVIGPVVTTVLWYLAGVLCALHYLAVATQPIDGIVWLLALYAAAGFAPLTRAFRRSRLATIFEDAEVFTTLPTSQLDHPIVVRMNLKVRRHVELREVRLSLVCRQYTGLSSQRIFTVSHTVLEHKAVDAGALITDVHGFEVPTKKRRPSSPYRRFDYPRTDWQIELSVVLLDDSAFFTRFPIEATLMKRMSKTEGDHHAADARRAG